MSLSKISKIANSDEKKSKIIVLVGNVLDDEWMFDLPKLKVCALKFSDSARKRIIKSGGECISFD